MSNKTIDIMRFLSFRLATTLAFAVAVTFQSCSEDEESIPAQERPWELYVVEPGNFTINSADVVLNDGTRSGSYSDGTLFYNTYIRRSELPDNVEFEYYTIRAYIPSNDTYGTSVSGFGMSLYHGVESERVRLIGDQSQSRTIGITTIRGTQYSVFEIVVRDPDFHGNKYNVDKMIFVFRVKYFLRSTSEIVNEDVINLEVFTDTEPSSSGGSGEFGTSTFWVNQDYGCGYINVSISGYGTQTISAYNDSNPGCGAEGSANFTGLPFGTYYYSASGSGCSWNNNFTISSDCATVQLTL